MFASVKQGGSNYTERNFARSQAMPIAENYLRASNLFFTNEYISSPRYFFSSHFCPKKGGLYKEGKTTAGRTRQNRTIKYLALDYTKLLLKVLK